MKLYRIIILILFVIVTCVFGVFFIIEKSTSDTTVPVISMEGDDLEVSINATDEELLAGVTAYDEKDGDITSEVVVESVSRFISKGVCDITYAVMDSDKHVASASRQITYTDYESPEFTLSDDLIFGVASSVKFSEYVGATDMIDGNISSRVMINSSNFNASTAGNYNISLQVSNSKGDTIYASLPVLIENVKPDDPVITLNKYLEYIQVGDTLNPASYVKEASNSEDDPIPVSQVTSDSYVDTSAEGTYYVDYYVTDSEGGTGHTRLIVIVQ